MLLQTTTTDASIPASRRGLYTGLRQWAACFFMGFLAVTAYWAGVFSYDFVSTTNRCYSALFQPAGLTVQSSGLACGHLIQPRQVLHCKQ